MKPYIRSGAIRIVFDRFTEDWSSENAYMDMRQYIDLSMSVPDVIISAYNGMSNGAIKALEENNVEKFPLITSQDADVPYCRKLQNNKQKIVLFKSIRLEAESAAEIVMKVVLSDKIECNSKVFNGK